MFRVTRPETATELRPTDGMWPSSMPESISPISPGPSSDFDSAPHALSGSDKLPPSVAIASRPQNIHAISTTRLVNPPLIMPNRAASSLVADPPDDMLCERPMIWMRLPKVIAAMEYQAYSLDAAVPTSWNTLSG